MRWKRWLWAFAALPFIGLPLIAQEPTPPQPASETTAPSEAETAATPAAPATAPASDSPEAASTEEQRPADEKISADNNLSFPVDI